MATLIQMVPPRILPESGLTDRQLEVLVAMSRGYTNHDIANLLEIAHDTVKNHATAIYNTLSIKTPEKRVKAVLHYYKEQWNLNPNVGVAFSHLPYKENLKIPFF